MSTSDIDDVSITVLSQLRYSSTPVRHPPTHHDDPLRFLTEVAMAVELSPTSSGISGSLEDATNTENDAALNHSCVMDLDHEAEEEEDFVPEETTPSHSHTAFASSSTSSFSSMDTLSHPSLTIKIPGRSKSSTATTTRSSSHQVLVYTQFEELYLTSNPSAPIFKTFEEAYAYGKHLGLQCGFHLRTKTTTVNQKEDVVTKFICCQRQGLAEHGWKPKNGIRQRHRMSVRCDCKWGCRLVGRNRGSVWYWDEPVHGHQHNHPLDAVAKSKPRRQAAAVLTRSNSTITSGAPEVMSVEVGNTVDEEEARHVFKGCRPTTARTRAKQTHPYGTRRAAHEE